MTDQNNETDLESRIDATLAQIFPGVDLEHQRYFKLHVGHTVLEKSSRDYVNGRADVLVKRDGENLAVLELKRSGLPLTDDDVTQGWSYAALAGAPLVVISNGSDTRILRTHDRAPISDSSLDAAELTKQLQFAASAAEASVTNAIERLLGTDLGLPATQAINNVELGEQSGSWMERAPFVEDFLVPRTVTDEVRSILQAGEHRAVVVSGAPLCGKSSVLRELVTTMPTTEAIPLYIDGYNCSEGLFRRLANVLSAKFGWSTNPDQARAWLRKVAIDPARPVVLCIDAPGDSSRLRAEIDEIMTGDVGNVRLVLALDEAELDNWLMKPGSRNESRLGKKGKVVTVDHYSDKEFEAASSRLVELGGRFVDGSSFSQELRAPWVLRAAVAPQMEAAESERIAVLPPTLGWDTLRIAEQKFDRLGDPQDALESVARAYLEFIVTSKSGDLDLASLYDFLVDYQFLRDRVEKDDIKALVQAGILQARRSRATATLYHVRVPPLFAAAITKRLHFSVENMLSGDKDPETIAGWLINRCSRMPFGDVIGAAVVHRLLTLTPGEAALPLVNALLDMKPALQKLVPGAKWLAEIPGVGNVELELAEGRNLLVRPRSDRSKEYKVKLDDHEMPTIADQHAWLILSQTRLFNVLVGSKGHSNLRNAAAEILLEVGTCPVMLRRPGEQAEEFHFHNVGSTEVPCSDMGIVEPVTWAIAELLSGRPFRDGRDAWVKRAAESDSVPLLARVTQALQHLRQVAGHSEWAETMLRDHCQPNWKEIH